MRADKVDALFFLGPAPTLAILETAMQTVGWYPEGILEPANLYDPALIADGGTAIKNTWVTTQYFPFESAAHNAPTKQYIDIMGADDPSGKVAGLGLFSWDAWLLFATAARDCGSTLTRDCLLTKAAAHPDWDAGGIKSLVSTATTNEHMSECWMTLKAGPTGFTPDPDIPPPNSGSFDCDPANVVRLKGNYTKG